MARTIVVIDPLGTNLVLIGAQFLLLRGRVVEPGDSVVRLDYVNQVGIGNITTGADALNSLLGTLSGDVLVFAYSEGAQVATVWFREYGVNAPVQPTGRLEFLLIGNSERRYGGLLYKQNGFGQIADTQGLPEPAGDGSSTVHYRVTDFARQYDGFADFPNADDIQQAVASVGNVASGDLQYALRAIQDVANAVIGEHRDAVWNALMGASLVHENYLFVHPDDPHNVRFADPDHPLVEYVWSPTYPVPVLGGGSAFPSLDRQNRLSIETAYDRPVELPMPAYQYISLFTTDFFETPDQNVDPNRLGWIADEAETVLSKTVIIGASAVVVTEITNTTAEAETLLRATAGLSAVGELFGMEYTASAGFSAQAGLSLIVSISGGVVSVPLPLDLSAGMAATAAVFGEVHTVSTVLGMSAVVSTGEPEGFAGTTTTTVTITGRAETSIDYDVNQPDIHGFAIGSPTLGNPLRFWSDGEIIDIFQDDAVRPYLLGKDLDGYPVFRGDGNNIYRLVGGIPELITTGPLATNMSRFCYLNGDLYRWIEGLYRWTGSGWVTVAGGTFTKGMTPTPNNTIIGIDGSGSRWQEYTTSGQRTALPGFPPTWSFDDLAYDDTGKLVATQIGGSWTGRLVDMTAAYNGTGNATPIGPDVIPGDVFGLEWITLSAPKPNRFQPTARAGMSNVGVGSSPHSVGYRALVTDGSTDEILDVGTNSVFGSTYPVTPGGIAIDPIGRIYIVGLNDRILYEYSAGIMINTLSFPSGVRPLAIVFDPSGDLVISTDHGMSRWDRVSVTSMTNFYTAGGGNPPSGLTIDRFGAIWYVDGIGNDVWRYDPATGHTDKPIPEGYSFVKPSGIAAHPLADAIYIIDSHNIYIWNGTGRSTYRTFTGTSYEDIAFLPQLTT